MLFVPACRSHVDTEASLHYRRATQVSAAIVHRAENLSGMLLAFGPAEKAQRCPNSCNPLGCFSSAYRMNSRLVLF